MRAAFDVAIIGGGPAGASAGIAALAKGLRVVLFEAGSTPHSRPGETLHPGITPILRQLGVEDEVAALSGLRPVAVEIAWGAKTRLDPYGFDERGRWSGYQVPRDALDTVLLAKFAALGGILVRPARRLAPIVEADGCVSGIRFEGGEVRSAVAIDATGSRGFLRRWLSIDRRRISPPLVARYGYRHGNFGATPSLIGQPLGWIWIAQVETNRIAWVRLAFDGSPSLGVPSQLATLPDAGGSGAADVSWRMSARLAGPGWFMAGDAACVIDPAGSHGVLRGLMSGMMAAHCAAELLAGAVSPAWAATSYAAWLQSWFQQDVARLLQLYADIGVDWAGAMLASYHHAKRRTVYA